MEKMNKNADRFSKIVLTGIVVPFMLVFILAAMPFYLLGLFFIWAFKLELL